MNINFELYKVFYYVAKNNNITRAANELFISQPAVSKSIKTLEEELGGKLFFRSKRGVILTDAGKELYSSVKSIMEQFNDAENKFSNNINLKSGSLKIGVSTTIAREFLIDYLKEFHDNFPDIEIKIDTNHSNDLFDKLKVGLLDLVILTLPTEIPNNISFVKCKEIHDILIARNDFPVSSINVKDLKHYSLILQDKNSNTRKFIDKYLLQEGIVLEPTMELSSYSLAIDFIKIGLGIGFSVKEFTNKDNLKEIKLIPSLPKRDIVIAFPSERSISNASKKLLDIIAK